jgi:tRNA A-37 threonylcarbamoyl transferase component Bud32
MSTEKQRSDRMYSDQLLDFESQLRYTMNDQALQQDVLRAIRELLSEDRKSEAEIRRILLDRFEAGDLREETFQVVQRMLDQIVSEYVPTIPDPDEAPDFSRTDVLPDRAAVRDQRAGQAQAGVVPTADHAPDFGQTDVLPGRGLIAEEPTDQLQPGSILRDRFLLQQRVSGGSMGVVYKALDRRLAEVDGVEPWVAIKVLVPRLSRNATALRAIQQEAAKGRCLSHPNIVRFIDLDRDDDTYFLVMEWIEGRSLAAILDDPESKTLETPRALEIVRQLAAALEYAHRCGVVHADVKPGNVMLTDDGHVKLIDFGVARIRQSQTDTAARYDLKILGAATPAYSSMQVLTGQDPVPADDVFSLACLMYRLVAGYRVFGPRNAAEAAEEGMTPQRPQGLDDHQWQTLKKALAFSRVARFSSPKAFVDELLGEAGVQPPARAEDEETAINAVVRPAARQTRRWWIAIPIVAAIGAGLAWWAGLPGDASTSPVSGLEYVEPTEPAAPVAARAAQAPSGPEATTSGDEDASTSAASEVPDGTEVVAVESQAAAPAPGAALPGGADEAAPADPEVAEPAGADEAAPVDLDGAVPTGADEPETSGKPAAATLESIRRPPTHELALGNAQSSDPVALDVVVREDGGDAVIDLIRAEGLSSGLTVSVDEASFTGNRSPYASGQYVVANDGIVNFAPGQSIAQLVVSAAADPLREADVRAQLMIREAYLGDELGLINLTLEDDDQRDFEVGLSVDTIGFAVSQVSVAEGETAAQIDLLRYRPGPAELSVALRTIDVNATRDVDYFPPSESTVVFAAGQRTIRILVPLVQDAEVEGDEAFFLELSDAPTETDADIFRRVAVTIRDDDG